MDLQPNTRTHNSYNTNPHTGFTQTTYPHHHRFETHTQVHTIQPTQGFIQIHTTSNSPFEAIRESGREEEKKRKIGKERESRAKSRKGESHRRGWW